MEFRTETVCTSLRDLDLTAAVRAIHQAHLQLAALNANCDCTPYDNAPALAALANCLRIAGHPGFAG